MVARAKVVFSIGLGLEQWLEKLAQAAGTGGPRIVRLGESLPAQELIAGDPHVWLDPVLAQKMVRTVAAVLAEIDPAHRRLFAQRAAAYQGQLQRLAQECQTALTRAAVRHVVTYHAAFAYLLRRCGLQMLGVIERQPGREPTSAYLAHLVAQMRSQGVRVVFSEPQLPQKLAAVVAEEVGGRVVKLDPLGSPDDPERNTYLALMRFNLRQLQQALGAE
jgi:ABC-type Zn uptake system ZnuABC Zn-binding protein ZnuA